MEATNVTILKRLRLRRGNVRQIYLPEWKRLRTCGGATAPTDEELKGQAARIKATLVVIFNEGRTWWFLCRKAA